MSTRQTFRPQQFILNRVWYVSRPVTFLAEATPEECKAMLQKAVKPDKDQLHLQELFLKGRRYNLQPRRDGFFLLTNSKDYWRYTEGMLRIKRRTYAAARVVATLTEVSGHYTRLELQAHMRVGYLLDILYLPAFFSSIVVFMPWSWWVMGLLVAALFLSSFVYHYYNAAYQANEMFFFVEKVLMDKLITGLPSLDAVNPDMLRDFEQEWERFYTTHRPSD